MKYYAPTKLSDNIHETPEGFLLCVGVPIARTGEMVYGENETPLQVGPDGIITVSRSDDEVFSEKTMASFEGKALTIGHPDAFVSPSNWTELAKGVIKNVRRGSGEQSSDLIADILVMDAMAIGLVKQGLREVSCGYEAEYVQDEPGKGQQKNIIGNHLALVQEGRAGPAYAINDSKKKGVNSMPNKLGDKIKALFTKAADEAIKVADEEMEEKKEKSDDAVSYDELVKICKDLGEKVDALAAKAAPKDAEKADPEMAEKKADDAEVAPGLEDRLKALEMAVQKILQSETAESESMNADEDMEEAEASDMEGVVETGDTAARAEILAPGIAKTKDVKVKALRHAYGTTEGKKIIDALTDGKAPAFDSAERVDTLFIAASELLKTSRTEQLAKTKTHDFLSNMGVREGVMTAEKINERNKTFYGQK